MNSALLAGGLFVFACYACCVSHVAIHSCVHWTLTKDKTADRWIGVVLASVQLTHFEGWRAAHLLHHRFTNREQDPHRVDRPLLPYLLTHYWRITRAVWNPAQHLAALAPPLLVASGVVAWQAWAGEPLRGLGLVVGLWFLPVIFGHFWVAHFNYITHVDLPTTRGENTRDMSRGLWTLANWLTFNFYLHKQHHLRPSEGIPRLGMEKS